MPTPILAAHPHRLYRRSMPFFVLAFLSFVSITGLRNSCLASAAEPASTVPPPGAAPKSTSAPTSAPASNFAPATREELAVAYRRIDTLLQKQLDDGAPPANLADLNKSFDAATLKFFSGQFATVLKDLAEVAGTLNPGTSASDADAWLALRSLGVVFDLQGPEPHAIFRSLFPLPRAVNSTLLVSIGSGPSSDFESHPLKIEPGSPAEIRIPLKRFVHPHTDRGLVIQYTVPAAAQAEHWESRPFILPSPEHQAMIDDLESQFAAAPEVVNTSTQRAVVRARLNMLKDGRSSANSFYFLGHANRVLAEIQGNFKLLRYGKSPFAGRDGLVYCPVILEGTAIPNYVYAPPSAFNQGPVPLVIALHGAGGDEAMFMNAYGNGEAKRQAELHGCILASPSTTALMTSPAVLDALIAQVAADYPIDRSRIFVIGHSMGAGAASGLARSRASTLAGVVCLAGGRVSTKPLTSGEAIAPILAIYAALDPLTGPVDVNRINANAKQNNLAIEAREMKDWGHTLMVGQALPQAFEWMMKQPPLRTAPAK